MPVSSTPFPINDFGGLELSLDPAEVGASRAVDMLNSDPLHTPGRVETRVGMTRLGTGTATYSWIGAGKDYTAFPGRTIEAIRNTGSVMQGTSFNIGTGVATNWANTWGAATTRVTDSFRYRFGSVDELVVASYTSATGLNEAPITQDGGVLGAVGKPRYLGFTPWDQRRVHAHFTTSTDTPSGANGSVSAVFFSDPGSAVWSANNWIELDPFDGDEITGVVSWRELLFVVKQRNMYVFYGTSTDADGEPVFLYRRVMLPARARATVNGGGRNVVAAGDGVYLLLADGLYRTTGDTLVRVSAPVTPIFDGTGAAGLLFPSSGEWQLGYAMNRIYLTYTVSSTFWTLVYDTPTGKWLLWDLSAGQSAQPTQVIEWTNSNGGLPVAYVAAGAKVYSLGGTTDDGTAIAWSYTSGAYDPSGANRVSITLESAVSGTGTVTLKVANDFGSFDTGSALTLGASPALAQAWQQIDREGTFWQHKFSGSGPASVSRLVHMISFVKPPGVQ